MLGSTHGRRKVGQTFPKSAVCSLEEQKRPKVLPMGSSASLKNIISIQNQFQAGSTSRAMCPEYFLSFSKRSTVAARIPLFLASDRSLGSNTLICRMFWPETLSTAGAYGPMTSGPVFPPAANPASAPSAPRIASASSRLRRSALAWL